MTYDIYYVSPVNGEATIKLHRSTCSFIQRSDRALKATNEIKIPASNYRVLNCLKCKPDTSHIRVYSDSGEELTSHQVPRAVTSKIIPSDSLSWAKSQHIPDESWRSEAACKGMGFNVFFIDGESGWSLVPNDKAQELILAAQTICMGCPVQARCLNYAIQEHIDDGIWGGAIPSQRKSIARKLQKARRIRYRENLEGVI